MIEVNKLVKVYGEVGDTAVYALNGIDLTINDGEFVGIIGESGSGKSTLLNLIGALDLPTSGSIKVDGVEITGFNEKQAAEFRRNNLGFVFQNAYLDEDLTVSQNVQVPLMLHGIDKKERVKRANEALTSLGLKSKLNKRISELSGGQLQRVSIARAIVNNAKIILADEPTGNLDSGNGRAVIELFRSLAERGITVILVTHNLAEARYCDRLIRLSDGKVVNSDEDR